MDSKYFRLNRHTIQALIILVLLCSLLVSCNAPGNTEPDQDLAQPTTADLNTVGESPVTRAELILQLAPQIFGESYQPPSATGTVFNDLEGHWAEDLIEAFANEGYIAGYPDGTFKPDNFISRAEAAVFLLRTKYGPSYSPPSPTGGVFADIDGHWAQAWIEVLTADGVLDSQPDSNFRPADKITQREVIVWILQVFGES
jgi:hypothetical protein